MPKFFGKLKPLLTTLAAVTISTTTCVSIARADAIDVPYLTNIQNYTNSILSAVNQLPTYLNQIAQLAATFLAADASSTDPVNWGTNWGNEATWLSGIANDDLSNEANQLNIQQNILNTFFGSANITAANPQNMNDLTYTTLLGQPPLSPDPRSGVNASMNYITNASGLAVKLPIPGAGWRGKQSDQQNYQSFFNTVTAVQTYNAYVLGRLYQDAQTYNNDYSLRKNLIQQSTNSNWVTSVATNDLGWVLRQTLLFNSQTYVLMDQILLMNKQIAASLAMANALLVANSLFASPSLVTKAQGGT